MTSSAAIIGGKSLLCTCELFNIYRSLIIWLSVYKYLWKSGVFPSMYHWFNNSIWFWRFYSPFQTAVIIQQNQCDFINWYLVKYVNVVAGKTVCNCIHMYVSNFQKFIHEVTKFFDCNLLYVFSCLHFSDGRNDFENVFQLRKKYIQIHIAIKKIRNLVIIYKLESLFDNTDLWNLFILIFVSK